MGNVNLALGSYKTPETYGKRLNSKELKSSIKNLVKELLIKNPEITQDQIGCVVQDYILNIKKSGTNIGNAKKNELGALADTIQTVRQEIANEIYLKNQQIESIAKKSVDEIPSEVLRANSRLPITNRTQKEKEKVNNQEYISSKKKKLQKQELQKQSQAEKNLARVADSKSQQNARYLTSNMQMSAEARKAYEMVENNNLRYIANEAKASAEVFGMPRRKANAFHSAKVFMDNGFAPIEPKPAAIQYIPYEVTKEVIKEVPKVEIKEVIKEVPKVEVKEIVKEIVKEVPKEKIVEKEVVKEVVKEVPKNNKLLLAGAAVLGGVLTWIGTKISNKNQSA